MLRRWTIVPTVLLLACGGTSAPPAEQTTEVVTPRPPTNAGPQGASGKRPSNRLPPADGPDADGDHLSDAQEAELGTDPNDADSDGDGQKDGVEVLVYKTDPLNPDSDGDGEYDGRELFVLGTDPLVPNTPGEVNTKPLIRGPAYDPTTGEGARHPITGEPMPARSARPGNRQGPSGPSKKTKVPRVVRDVCGPEDLSKGPTPPESCQCNTDGSPKKSSQCWLQVPSGSFLMGAQSKDANGKNYDSLAQPDEGPPHEVTIEGFWIQRLEVTNTAYAQCVDAGGCDPTDVDATEGISTYSTSSSRTLPLTAVNWKGANDYCTWLTAALPSESEWEYAARGNTARSYPWGNNPNCGVMSPSWRGQKEPIDETCEFSEVPLPADLRGPSAFYALGMGGSVMEWVKDWYGEDAYRSAANANPTGPSKGKTRVLRGGGWMAQSPEEFRAAARSAMDPTLQLPDVGFRCIWRPGGTP